MVNGQYLEGGHNIMPDWCRLIALIQPASQPLLYGTAKTLREQPKGGSKDKDKLCSTRTGTSTTTDNNFNY